MIFIACDGTYNKVLQIRPQSPDEILICSLVLLEKLCTIVISEVNVFLIHLTVKKIVAQLKASSFLELKN